LLDAAPAASCLRERANERGSERARESEREGERERERERTFRPESLSRASERDRAWGKYAVTAARNAAF